MTPSNVTRRLAGLEQRLGIRLIARSRVRSTVTDAGQRYYRELKTLLEQFDALENDVAGAATEPRGLLRVAGPSVFGARHLGPWLHELQRRAPALTVELLLSDQIVDLVEQGIDIAVRIGSPRDSSLTARRLGTLLTAVVASPDYLARTGTPKGPEALEQHEFIQHLPFRDEKLTLTGPKGRTVTVTCATRFTVSNILGVMEAVKAGAGLNAGPLWLYADAIARGELVHVLPRWDPGRGSIHALVLPGKYRPAKIDVALDMLREQVPRLPGIVA
jgi:DNA-binding transcriptional LysR family regulator